MKNKSKDYFVVFSAQLARYLALNGVVWEEVRQHSKDSTKTIFLYNRTEELYKTMQRYAASKQGEDSNHEQHKTNSSSV